MTHAGADLRGRCSPELMKWSFKTIRVDLLTWRRYPFLPIMLQQAWRFANPINTSSLSNDPKQKVIAGQEGARAWHL